MWCTECKVAFNWNSGKIIYGGQIHNPHYYQYMRDQNNGINAPRNPGDVLCGGLIPYYSLSTLLRKINTYNQLGYYNTLKTNSIIYDFMTTNNIKQIGDFCIILSNTK